MLNENSDEIEHHHCVEQLDKKIMFIEKILAYLKKINAKKFECLSPSEQSFVISVINEYSGYLKSTFGILYDESVLLPYCNRNVTNRDYGNCVRAIIKDCRDILKNLKKDNANNLTLIKKYR